MTPPADVLGGPDDRAALMLADRRHRRSNGREVCQHDGESWPCDARRLADALCRMIEDAEAWREHARLDCEALGRVWRVTAWWSRQAAGIEQRPAGRRLIQSVTRVRQAITGIGS